MGSHHHEAVEDGKVEMKYMPTAKNVADIFMKALPKPKFTEKLHLAIMKQ